MKKILSLIAIIILNSCIFIPQNVTINPKIKSYEENLGNRSSIKVIVSDRRHNNSNIIGYRGTGSQVMAAISTSHDISDLIKSHIIYELERKGFRTTRSRNYKTLEISIIDIKYNSSWGFFTVGTNVITTLDAIVTDKRNRILYRKIYRGVVDNHHLFTPLASTNEKNINKSVQSAMQSMIDDHNLVKYMKYGFDKKRRSRKSKKRKSRIRR